jgi:RNA polymerase sigma-70 factor (ECF subfamily)
VVLLAAQSQTAGFNEALAELCNLYWYPLYGFVRQRGYSPEDAQDLTQGFFAHLLERKALTRVDRQKGRFRSFLLAALQNYLSNEAGRTGCLKRGGKVEFVSLDLQRAEDRYRLEPVEALTPGKVFDARWAMALLAEAMNRLSREYIDQGKTNTFAALKDFLDPLNSKKLPPYEQVADELKVSVAAVKTLIHRFRKQYTAFVREEISRTVSDAGDLGAETHELCEALIAAGGWVMP